MIAAILEKQPPAIEPEWLNRVVRASVAKNPSERIQTAIDLKRMLEWGSGAPSISPPPVTRSRHWRGWPVVAMAGVVVAALAWLGLRPWTSPPAPFALTIVPPAGSGPVLASDSPLTPEISPDGSAVMYAGSGGLWVRRLDSLEPQFLRGSERFSNAPCWSADSKAVIFPALENLIRIRVPDGAPEVISRIMVGERGAAVSDRGTILLVTGSRLAIAPPGGQAQPVDVQALKVGEVKDPQFLPGSEDFLLLALPRRGDGEVYLATLRDGKVVNSTFLMKSDTSVRYTRAGGGRILFVRDDNLYSQRLDRKGRRLEGEPVLFQRGVASLPGFGQNRAAFSVSRSGMVAWRPGESRIQPGEHVRPAWPGDRHSRRAGPLQRHHRLAG